MINFYDCEILNILPSYLKEYPEVQAVSYAVKKAMQKLRKYADSTRVYAVVDDMPENILDVLGVELRTPYYDEEMQREAKRKLVKNTLIWYQRAGTPSAVEELISIVFGEAKVKEWFEYNGTPGTFRVETGTTITPEMAEYFVRMIKRVKNTRSHLELVSVPRTLESSAYIGLGHSHKYKWEIR